MSALDTLKNALARGLDTLRGPLPELVKPVSNTTQTSPSPVAIADSPFRPVTITKSQFVAGATWAANEWRNLAYFEVTADTQFKVLAGKKIKLAVPALSRLPGQNLGAAANRDVVLTGLVATPQATPALPTAPPNYHPEVKVLALVGGNWITCKIVAINYGTFTLTFEEPAAVATAADNIRVFYLHDLGEWRFMASRDLGKIDTSDATLVNSSFGNTHAVNQIDAETALYWPNNTDLVYGQKLVLQVRTPVEVVFDNQSPVRIEVETARRDLTILDQRKLGMLSENAARGGV